ncbi:MAG: FAD-dependent oxidoreductase [Verrucomicrobia bacterium]|nr:FAD-dependent oxidoreductase [Verrucomicrobiota bacterium]
MSGVSYRLGRESVQEYREPMAGVLYKPWFLPPADGSTGEGDDRIQAYNYRLCLTDNAANQVAFARPEGYDRSEYLLLAECWKEQRFAGIPGRELLLDGIGFVTNMVMLPNRKTDANNQHLAFISTDLPEENNPWPEADWAWRDQYALRLRRYTEGLFYFAATDESLPESFRSKVRQWGFAKDEYTDNGNFPRQVYVREARRIRGSFTLTAHDTLPLLPGYRPPVYSSSITGSCYALDSHACRKAEPGKPALEGSLTTAVFPTLFLTR